MSRPSTRPKAPLCTICQVVHTPFGVCTDCQESMEQAPEREIPAHSHDNSVMTRCLACYAWGTNIPIPFGKKDGCGNCGSRETVTYYPPCCIRAERREKGETFDAGLEAAAAEAKRFDHDLNDSCCNGTAAAITEAIRQLKADPNEEYSCGKQVRGKYLFCSAKCIAKSAFMGLRKP